MTYIVGASIRLKTLQVCWTSGDGSEDFRRAVLDTGGHFHGNCGLCAANRLGDFATCSKVVLWARHVQTQPSGSRTPSHILKAKVPPVRGLISGRDTCKPSLREADHLHRFSRQHCHSSECCSLGARRANPAFGKPNTSFTFSYDNRGQRAAVAYTTALPLFSVEFHFARHDNCRQSAAEQRPSTILATGLRLLLPGAAHRQ